MLKHAWKDPVWSKVIATVIVGGASALGTYLLGYWPSLLRAPGAAWSFLRASSAVSHWVLALLGVGTLVALSLLAVVGWQLVAGPRVAAPGWLGYTSDTFFGLKWRWRWSGGYLVDLCTFCPTCDYQVFARDISNYRVIDRIAFACDSCGRDVVELDESQAHLESKVQRFIKQKIRRDVEQSATAR